MAASVNKQGHLVFTFPSVDAENYGFLLKGILTCIEETICSESYGLSYPLEKGDGDRNPINQVSFLLYALRDILPTPNQSIRMFEANEPT